MVPLSVLIGFVAALLLVMPLALFLARVSARQARLLERRTRQAQQLTELASLTGGLAHEIRNPLATLRLNFDLLDEDWQTDDPADLPEIARRSRNKLAMLRRETERLDDILEDFLRYAGQHRLEFERVDLNRVAQELLEFFGPQAAAAHVQIRCGLTPDPLPVKLDANLFKQAVLNLLINAQQAMTPSRREEASDKRGGAGDGGQVDSALPRVGGELIVRSFRTDHHACLEIADTGPGIEPDRLGRIFEAYYSTKRGGTGLGLPTTRRIVEEHDGLIDVHSEPGKGTSFTIRLPMAGES